MQETDRHAKLHAGRGPRAIFLDRDGTLVHPHHYPSRPEDLRLYQGIGGGLSRLQAAGFRLIVITNQSGVARGYFSEEDLDRMHRYLREELRALGVELDAIYHCPHHEEGVVPGLAVQCSCRKPKPGMLQRAASEMGIDAGASWLVGDILDDVEAGRRFGCRTVLVDIGTESPPTSELRRPDLVARDTAHALDMIAYLEGRGSRVDLSYLPPSWEAVHAAG